MCSLYTYLEVIPEERRHIPKKKREKMATILIELRVNTKTYNSISQYTTAVFLFVEKKGLPVATTIYELVVYSIPYRCLTEYMAGG